MSAHSEGGLPRIIDDLYAGTLDEEAWNRAIRSIADCVRGSGAVLLAFNPATQALLRWENHRLDPNVMDDYRSYWSRQDPRFAASASVPAGEPLTELTVPIPRWHLSPILNEFLIPADYPYCMPVWLRKAASKMVALSIQGSRKRGPFGQQDIESFKALSPHVSRALEIRDRLEAANFTIHTLSSCIDRVHFGVIALDLDGKILLANAMAEQLLKDERALHRSSDGTLIVNDVGAAQMLRRSNGRGASTAQPERLFRVQRGPGRWPLCVVVTPAPETPASWIDPQPARMVFLFDPETRIQPQLEFVAQDLGISSREAEIAALLSMGLELPGIATRLSISIHTVRTHMKAIFSKTGIRSQAELVRHVIVGPSVHGPAASGIQAESTVRPSKDVKSL